MAAELSKTDFEIILNLAEYRLLTIRQLAVLYPHSSRLLRNKLKQFTQCDLVRMDSVPSVGKQGRPSDIYSVGEAGHKLLRSKKKLAADIDFDRVNVISSHSRAHMMAINDFRIQLVLTEKIVPSLNIHFLSPNSPFIARINDKQTVVNERISVNATDRKPIRYTPDGVFTMHCSRLKKTLLFFLEMDRATESMGSETGYKNNIRQKVLNYQLTYKLQRYKRYESVFNSRLRGFRLLLVTSQTGHLAKLSKVLTESPPSEFVHTTDFQRFSAEGLWSAIWHKGGRLDLRPVSILGSRTPHDPPTPKTLYQQIR